jgi:hypothetical protein
MRSFSVVAEYRRTPIVTSESFRNPVQYGRAAAAIVDLLDQINDLAGGLFRCAATGEG